MTDKDDDRGGNATLLLLGLGLAGGVFAAGYVTARIRAASGFGPGAPCAGCAEKAERARQAEQAEAEAYADAQAGQAAADLAAAEASAGRVNGAAPSVAADEAGSASVG